MKCPKCGYNIGNVRNFTPGIKIYMDGFSNNTRSALSSIFKEIGDYHPATTVKEIYFFLREIADIDEKSIRWTINQYYNSGAYKTKGLPYLGGMIARSSKYKDKIIANEKKIHGTKPPEREVK